LGGEALAPAGKSHFVVVAPSDKQSKQIYYGDGKTFVRVPLPPWVLTGDNFFEPRFFAKTKNSNFRGLDMRLFATVDLDADKKTCSVSCGERKTDLQIMDADPKKALLGKASYQPRCRSAPRTGSPETTTAGTFTSTRATPRRPRRAFVSTLGPRGR